MIQIREGCFTIEPSISGRKLNLTLFGDIVKSNDPILTACGRIVLKNSDYVILSLQEYKALSDKTQNMTYELREK